MTHPPMMTNPSAEFSASRPWTYRRPLQLMAVGVAAALWLSGLVNGLAALMIICVPTAVIYNYEWLHRTLQRAPQK